MIVTNQIRRVLLVFSGILGLTICLPLLRANILLGGSFSELMLGVLGTILCIVCFDFYLYMLNEELKPKQQKKLTTTQLIGLMLEGTEDSSDEIAANPKGLPPLLKLNEEFEPIGMQMTKYDPYTRRRTLVNQGKSLSDKFAEGKGTCLGKGKSLSDRFATCKQCPKYRYYKEKNKNGRSSCKNC